MESDLLVWSSIRTLSPGGFPPGDGRRGGESARRLMAERAAIAAVAARGPAPRRTRGCAAERRPELQ